MDPGDPDVGDPVTRDAERLPRSSRPPRRPGGRPFRPRPRSRFRSELASFGRRATINRERWWYVASGTAGHQRAELLRRRPRGEHGAGCMGDQSGGGIANLFGRLPGTVDGLRLTGPKLPVMVEAWRRRDVSYGGVRSSSSGPVDGRGSRGHASSSRPSVRSSTRGVDCILRTFAEDRR